MHELRKMLTWLVLCGIAMLISGCNSAPSQMSKDKDTLTPIAPTQIAALSLLDNTPAATELSYITHTPTRTPTLIGTPRPTHTPDLRMAAKETYAASWEQTIVAHTTAVALTPTPLPPTPHLTYTPLPLPTGLSQNVYIGVHVCDCTFRNVWRQIINDEYIQVFAGAYTMYTPRPGKGMLYIEAFYLSDRISRINRYDAPNDAGAVHIVSANGSQLTLANDSSEQFIFDVVSRQWVSPPPTPSLTTTPAPTPILTSIPSPSVPPIPTIPPLPSPSP